MTSTSTTEFVLCRADVESASHYRTTFMAAAEAPVYITLVTDDQWACVHPSAVELTRFGDAHCHECGAIMWSLRWLAVDVFGPNTVEWGADRVRALHEAMRGQGVIVIDTIERRIIEAMGVEQEPEALVPGTLTALVKYGVLGDMPTPHAEPPAEVVAADLNVDMRANNRRSGVAVPLMAAVIPDWEPGPAA
jgi:hypothetical protein